MSTIFTRIIDGEIPGVFVWRDDRCVAFLSINPMHTGHALVVPREEVDHWIDLDPDLAAHLFQVSQTIGQAQMAALSARRIGVMVVGDEVPHVHNGVRWGTHLLGGDERAYREKVRELRAGLDATGAPAATPS